MASPASSLSTKVAVYDNAIPAAWTSRLRRYVHAAFHVPPTVSVWWALGQQPRNFFEQVIQHLNSIAAPQRPCVGVEYWMRVQPAASDFHFHFDRDEVISDRVVPPTLGSVLYLSAAGGPTMILSAEPGAKPHVPDRGHAVFPRPARFATFAGQLFHGVGGGQPNRWPRISFFANWWDHKPGAAQEAPRSYARLAPLARSLPARERPRRSRTYQKTFRPSSLLPDAEWLEMIRHAQAERRAPPGRELP